MQSRASVRFIRLAASLLAGVAAFVPALSASAASAEPPFEVFFPQEASQTEFRDTYGDHRSGGRTHKGIDLLAPRMTEVYAVADGVVFYVGTNNLSGRNLEIDHGDGWMSHYVHLNNDNVGTDDGEAPWTLAVAPGIEEGSEVTAGQLIAWVGDSGNAEGTTPHTHFELRLDGTSINPYALLVEAYGQAIALEEASQLFTDLPRYEIE